MQKLELMDWKWRKIETPIDLDNLSEIGQIEIRVISGDEVAIVTYKSGKQEVYDSSNDRIQDILDYKYILWYQDHFVIDKDTFLWRSNTYSVANYELYKRREVL